MWKVHRSGKTGRRLQNGHCECAVGGGLGMRGTVSGRILRGREGRAAEAISLSSRRSGYLPEVRKMRQEIASPAMTIRAGLPKGESPHPEGCLTSISRLAMTGDVSGDGFASNDHPCRCDQRGTSLSGRLSQNGHCECAVGGGLGVRGTVSGRILRGREGRVAEAISLSSR